MPLPLPLHPFLLLFVHFCTLSLTLGCRPGGASSLSREEPVLTVCCFLFRKRRTHAHTHNSSCSRSATNSSTRSPALGANSPNTESRTDSKSRTSRCTSVRFFGSFVDAPFPPPPCSISPTDADLLRLIAERSYNIRVPGFSGDEAKVSGTRRVNIPPGHAARLAAIREGGRRR